MSESSRDLNSSGENNTLGPDFFGYYTSEIKKLLSQDDDLLPFGHQVSRKAGSLHEVGREKASTKNSCGTPESNSIAGSSLFSNGIGTRLSESKKEKLKSVLRAECLYSLTGDARESLLSIDATTCKADQPQHPHKKLKALPACSDLESEYMHLTNPEKELSDNFTKKCIDCHATSTPQWRPAPDGKKLLCNACGVGYAKDPKESIMDSGIEVGKESIELDDDLRFILENDSTKVKQLMEIHSSEISNTLHHMEQKLEEILNILMTSCRAMTISEKQQLCKSIKKLPPRNLDRVAEIIDHNKPSEKHSSEVQVDLNILDNVTLWRLYFYVTTTQTTTTT